MLHIVLCPTVYNHLFRRKIEQEKYILGGSNCHKDDREDSAV